MYEAARNKIKAQVTLEKKVSESNQIGKFNEKRPESFQTRRKILKEIFRITWHHMCQIRRMTLLIIPLSSSLLMVGYGNFTALLPFAMAAGGHPAAEISYSLSIGALANTAVRIFVSWASDADWFSRKISFILGSVVSGVSTLAIVFVLDDLQWIIVTQIFWGLGIGANLSVYNNLLIDMCGRELYNAGVAITSLMTAVCNIVLGPLIGVASDFTSYNDGLGMTAALQMMCALIWIFMPLARRHDMKKFPDLQSPNQESDGKLKQSSGFTVLNRKLPYASYINKGFGTDLGLDYHKRHSVC